MRVAKERGVAVILVGHVTKEGALAGPRVLEHLVDCVLQFEGERERTYRTLRALKNRFGSTNEVGVFEMRDHGLVEVADPSARFVEEATLAPGSAVLCASSSVGMPHTGNSGSSPVPASCFTRYARMSSRNRSPNATASMSSAFARSTTARMQPS